MPGKKRIFFKMCLCSVYTNTDHNRLPGKNFVTLGICVTVKQCPCDDICLKLSF